MDIAGFHLPGAITAGATFASIYGVFARFDRIQSRSNRQFVGRWLTGLSVPQAGWDSFFIELFGRVFGNRHLSLKCAVRSVALSLFLIGLLYAYYWFARIPDNVKQEFTETFWGNPLNQILLLLPLITACVVDYLSLWKTRYLLSRITAFTRRITVVGVVLADLLGTMVLYISMFTVLAISILAVLAGSANGRILSVIPTAFKIVFEKFVLEGSSGLRLLPAATLLTSAWLWAYILAAYAMRLLSYIPPVLRFLSRIMDFTEHPVRSLGWVIAVLSSGAVAVGTAL